MRGTSGDRAVLPSGAQDALAGGAEISRCADVWCIVAGVPCQDVSVAGKRTGLHGERTGLFFEFARILRELRPAWFIFENVPGLLSSNGGRDFAEVLRVLMVECGYGVCWRVLDSQFFGVAQRRRRVFLVGRFGEPCPAEVLFERTSCGGDSAPGEEARTGVAREPARRTDIAGPLFQQNHKGGWFPNAEQAASGHLIAAPIGCGLAKLRHDQDGYPEHLVATLNSCGNAGGFRTEPGEHVVIEQNTQVSTPRLPSQRSHGTPNYAVAYNVHSAHSGAKKRHAYETGRTRSLDGTGGFATNQGGTVIRAAADADGVRDFAGLPEGLDSARYRALGNAITVPVMRWIAARIKTAETNAPCVREEEEKGE